MPVGGGGRARGGSRDLLYGVSKAKKVKTPIGLTMGLTQRACVRFKLLIPIVGAAITSGLVSISSDLAQISSGLA